MIDAPFPTERGCVAATSGSTSENCAAQDSSLRVPPVATAAADPARRGTQARSVRATHRPPERGCVAATSRSTSENRAAQDFSVRVPPLAAAAADPARRRTQPRSVRATHRPPERGCVAATSRSASENGAAQDSSLRVPPVATAAADPARRGTQARSVRATHRPPPEKIFNEGKPAPLPPHPVSGRTSTRDPLRFFPSLRCSAPPLPLRGRTSARQPTQNTAEMGRNAEKPGVAMDFGG